MNERLYSNELRRMGRVTIRYGAWGTTIWRMMHYNYEAHVKKSGEVLLGRILN